MLQKDETKRISVDDILNDPCVHMRILMNDNITLKRENEQVKRENELMKRENEQLKRENAEEKRRRDELERENELMKRENEQMKRENAEEKRRIIRNVSGTIVTIPSRTITKQEGNRFNNTTRKAETIIIGDTMSRV